MISFSILCFLLSFNNVQIVSEANNCSDLVEISSSKFSSTYVYTNKVRIPIVDNDGKMMFDLNIERKGKENKLILSPLRPCTFLDNSNIKLNFLNNVTYLLQADTDEEQKSIFTVLSDEALDMLLDERIQSIELNSVKYPFIITLKPQQSRLIQDVLICAQG